MNSKSRNQNMKNYSSPLSRRKFIGLTGSAALAIPALSKDVLGANERVRIGMVGCGGRARSLINMFAAVPNVQVVAVCDPDTAQMAGLLKKFAGKGENPRDVSGIAQIQDYRKLYEREDIDAVVIASTNSWHVLHAIHAMEAGKDVYIEKPVSWGIWEGQQLVAAEKKYNRIATVGFQNRSDPGPQEGIKFIQEGNLGKILSAHVCCFRNRSSIGARIAEPQKAPATCDYNLWLGPAADLPIHRKKFHYDWHWVWNTGNGDIGNQAPHEIDLACWVLGDGPLPKTMNSFGGRFAWNDAGNTPNLHTAWYEQAGVPVIIEVNDLKLSPDRNTSAIRNKIRVGIIVKCEGGELRGGRGGMYVVDENGQKIHNFKGNGGKLHQSNFIDAVRSRNREDVACSIVAGERSSAVAHLANISLQSGQVVESEALNKAIAHDEMLQTIGAEQQTQLSAWGIDKPSYTLGTTLSINPDMVAVAGPGLDQGLVRRDGRGEFKIPELV